LASDHALSHLVETTFAARGGRKNQVALKKIYWGAERFRLQYSKLFVSLPLERQEQILQHLSELNLALSYFIEKSALQFAAKMILLSDSCEEKMFYSLLSAEESTHLYEFKSYLWFQPSLSTHDHPMLRPLAEAIQYGTREALTFVIQVLLEGFGIAHYSGLRETCLDAHLKSSFQDILKDEARHHGAGLVLTKSRTMSQESREQVFELSRKFIRSLESAQWIPSAFKQAGVALSEAQTQILWEDIGFKDTLTLRMQKLREMFLKANQIDLYEQLSQNGVFGVQTL
jgi:rubrerythrin